MTDAPKLVGGPFSSIRHLFVNEERRQLLLLTLGITVAVLLCLAFPCQTPELIFALTGAAFYGARDVQGKLTTPKRLNPTKTVIPRKQRPSPQPVGFKPTARPIVPLKCVAKGWENEVDELVRKIQITPEINGLVQAIVSATRAAIQPAIPEAEIVGFASGNPILNRAFAMAVPEIHIVMKVSSAVLLQRLESRYTRGGSTSYRPDGKKLQKCAIRHCTEQLVAAGFKFRRSAFVSDDPKVCLLVPQSLGFCTESVAIEICVNSDVPLQTETIISECKSQDARAESLILLVRRWARDRGIAHASKGHLPICAWNLLTVFFLQVAPESDALLSPVGGAPIQPETKAIKHGSPKSVAELFRQFVAFYARDFNWQTEGISVRLGQRAPPPAELPLNYLEAKDG
eukprot:CAMPEP_0170589280 /NCGR_PEP_ID=MMETSP0224-20130122/11268_1 /TAXON_ID=285029 /ORGANISM="Togula jolla, Strain CCCM 725" /LENGTH=399 /DNA_ID=CAMNT_0010913031 /DNA_START=97 /DNA_END=1293 /DNA_ORIENTATION=-